MARDRYAYKAAKKAATKCKGSKCFVAGTLVLTESGERPIEEISSGEKVWSANPQTGEWQLQEVVVPISHVYDGDVVTIKVGDYATESTGGHPFWIVDGHALADRPVVEELPAAETELTDRGRWVEARDVEVGDTVLLHYRLRAYHPLLKTFLQRDPAGYIDGTVCHLACGIRTEA